MKKKVIPIIATTMAVAITVSGCSCAGSSPLSFNDAFKGGSEANSGYSETLTYDVKYVKNYGNNFQKSANVPDDLLKIELEDGTYTMTLDILDRNDVDVKGLDSNIIKEGNEIGNTVYKLTTELNVRPVYICNEDIDEEDIDGDGKNKYSENEYVKTVCYFLSSGYSFNPIYSKTEGRTSFVSLYQDSRVALGYANYSNEVKYNNDGFTYNSVYEQGGENSTPMTTDGSNGYSYKTVIDNNMLLFALRNIGLEKDAEYRLPTVHPTYGSAQPLLVRNVDERSQKFNINNLGEQDIKVKEYSFARNVQNGTGAPQYAVIQSEKTGSLENRALLLEYISPLSLFNNYLCIGGLRYTLKSVS